MNHVNARLLVLAAVTFAAPLPAQNPANDRVTLAGEFNGGHSFVVKTGSVYSFRYRNAPHAIEYRLDMADPAVQDGMIRIYEIYSDSYPIWEGGVAFRNASGALLLPSTLAPYVTLTSEALVGNTVVLEYTDSPPGGGVHRRRHTCTIKGQVFSITIEDLDSNTAYLNNYAGMFIGPTASTNSAQLLQMQGALSSPVIKFLNGTRTWFVGATIDLFQSNASDFLQPSSGSIPSGANSVDFSSNTTGAYKPNSGGQISAPLRDTWNVCVSQRSRDVFVRQTQGPSPYRELLRHRTTVLLSGAPTSWTAYNTHRQLFHTWGMDDLAIYCFDFWTASAVDPLGNQNQGPDWTPPSDPANFTAFATGARTQGDLFAAYTSFDTMPSTAPTPPYDASHICRTETGAPKLSNLNGSPMNTTTASGIHARREALALRQTYGLNAAYVDIQTYAPPGHGAGGDQIDQTLGSPWAKTMRRAFLDQKTWMRDMTDILQGPLLGEGSFATEAANTEWVWAGYCDSVQRAINSNHGSQTTSSLAVGNPLSPTLWPVIPEYELRVSSLAQSNHGNGLYPRFFSPSDTGMVQANGAPILPLTDAAQDRYRIYEITYGHISYFQTSGSPGATVGNSLTFSDMIKEYYLMHALQARQSESPVKYIGYMHQGVLKTFDSIIAQGGTAATFINPQIKIVYQNGLQIYVNHSPANWAVTVGGVAYSVPEDGFVAYQASTPIAFVAFSAIPPTTNGNRIDYCYAPGEYEFFDGRNQELGYGAISTNQRRVAVQNFIRGVGLRELASNGSISVTTTTPPSVTSVVIQAPNTLAVGDRRPAKAIAHYSNGAFRNVTSLVTWSSSNSTVATINSGGALIGVSPGQANLSTTSFQGVTPSSLTVTVP